MLKGRILNWEAHLVVRASEGDAVASAIICDEYRPVLHQLAMRLLRNSDDANDAVQETLVKSLRSISDFNPERPLKPWLCRICANCCVDVIRSRRRDGDPLDQHEYMLDNGEDVDQSAAGSIRNGQVMEAVERLPDNYRRIIFMRHFRHMEVNEIAEALNKPEGTIKSWLFRARAMLRKDLHLALGS